MPDVLRPLVALWITVVLFRAARSAWTRRDLLRLIWAGIRGRQVAQALGLLMVTLTVASGLLMVPGLDIGLGHLVNFQGNAVFTPLEEAAGALGPPPASGPDWPLALLATAFLGLLLALLPWLAFVEEEIFRAGLEVEDLRGEVRSALRFGLVHLVMLVPIAAALAIATAGFGYGRIYRRRADTVDPSEVDAVLTREFRPTKRSTRAVSRQGLAAPKDVAVATIEPMIERRQAAGVLASASVHTAFNATIIVLVWLAIIIPALAG